MRPQTRMRVFPIWHVPTVLMLQRSLTLTLIRLMLSIMPSDGNFGFSVLIAGLPVPEYHREGKVYVESNLWTPVSYNQRVREMAYGEVGNTSSHGQ